MQLLGACFLLSTRILRWIKMQQQPSPYGPTGGHQFGSRSPYADPAANRLGPPLVSSSGSPLTSAVVDQHQPGKPSKSAHQHLAVSGITVTSHPLAAGPLKEKSVVGSAEGVPVPAPSSGIDSSPKNAARSMDDSAQICVQQPPDVSQMKNAPEVVPVDVMLQVADLSGQDSTTLCAIAKDIDREIINQIVDFFKTMKQLILPMQQQFPPSSQGGNVLKQTLDKQDKLQRSILVLFTRLSSVCLLLDDRFERLIPKNVTPQDFIPFVGQDNSALSEQLEKRGEADVQRELRSEHYERKRRLDELHFEVEEIMKLLRENYWNLSIMQST